MKRLLAVAVLASAMPIVHATPCEAVGSGAHRARIVVESDADAATFCLRFDEPSISGIEALRRVGLPVVVEDYGAGALTVCRIGAVGCEHPREPCFCECADTGACRYWGYFRRSGDEPWRFSEVGAADTSVRDGDVEGWRYDLHTVGGGNAPRSRDGECRTLGQATFLQVAATAPAPSRPWGLAAGIAASLALVAALAIRARRSRGASS